MVLYYLFPDTTLCDEVYECTDLKNTTGYIHIKRMWKKATITLSCDMTPLPKSPI